MVQEEYPGRLNGGRDRRQLVMTGRIGFDSPFGGVSHVSIPAWCNQPSEGLPTHREARPAVAGASSTLHVCDTRPIF